MRAREKSRAVRRIADLRALQRHAAQAQAMRMSALAVELREQREREAETLGERQAGWAMCHASGPLDLGMAQVWRQAIDGQGERLRRVDEDVARHEVELQAANRAWHAASLQADAAEGLAAKARRAVSHRSEEARVNDAEDRMSLKWGWR